MTEAAGLLLTGGAGRRMGRDKAELTFGRERLADRGARVLAAVCDPVLEVGPGRSALRATREDPPGSGPLAAVAAGGADLQALGHQGPTLVLAVDMPLVTEALLAFLRDFPGTGTVVPFVGGRGQPLCARYSAEALRTAGELAAAGERSMRSLLTSVPDVQWAGPRMWASVADERTFTDLDTPDDLTTAQGLVEE
jgi:molybdopterin-guanine dinucleotide biosynthesis protein A